MLLRASGEFSGRRLDVAAVTDEEAAAQSGVPHGQVLVGFCDALVARDERRLGAAREALLEALGAEGLVDAAGVASNFERMVRIADGCGIPLDAPLELVTGELRQRLGLDRFGSAANTPPAGLLRRALGRLIQPFAMRILRRMGRRPRRAADG